MSTSPASSAATPTPAHPPAPAPAVTKQQRYLNGILTVNALLLAGIVWMQLTSATATPLMSSTAFAQSPPSAGGVPNAGAQRLRQIEELQGIRDSIDAMRKQLESGKVKVTIGNIDELKAATKPADDKGK